MIAYTTIEETGQRVYKAIYKASEQPVRTFQELQKLMEVLTTQKVELIKLWDTLRNDIIQAKKDQSYDFSFNAPVFDRKFEIARDNTKTAIEAIESLEGWYNLAVRHKTLNNLEANQWCRTQAILILEKDLSHICGVGFTKQFAPSYELTKDLDYVYYILPFLKNGTKSLELYESIFGFGYIPIPDRLYLRLDEILYKRETSGLTRTEQQEFADQGFTRDCITRYFEILNNLMNAETNPDLRELFRLYIDDCYSNEAIKQHIPLI